MYQWFLTCSDYFSFVKIRWGKKMPKISFIMFVLDPPKYLIPHMRKIKAFLGQPLLGRDNSSNVIFSSELLSLPWWNSLWEFPEGGRGELGSLEDSRWIKKDDMCTMETRGSPFLPIDKSFKSAFHRFVFKGCSPYPDMPLTLQLQNASFELFLY